MKIVSLLNKRNPTDANAQKPKKAQRELVAEFVFLFGRVN